MSKIIYFLVLVTITNIGFSQIVTVQFGDIYKHSMKTHFEEFIGSDKQNGIFALRRHYSSYSSFSPKILEYYNKDLKLVYSKKIELPIKGMELEKVFFINDTLFAFITYFDKKTKINYLYGSYISTEGVLNINFVEVEAIKMDFKINFSIHNSVDSLQFVVSTVTGLDKESTAHFRILDHEFSQSDYSELVLPSEARYLSLEKIVLAPTGDFHIIASLVKWDNDIKKPNELRIFSYFKIDGNFHEHTFLIGQNDILECDMKIKPDNNLIMAGFYSDEGKKSFKGVFSLELITSSREIRNEKLTPFTEDFMKQFRSSNDKPLIINNYKIRDILFKSDETVQLLAEYYNLAHRANMNADGRVSYDNEYSYHSIIVVDFNKEGGVNWWRRIPKLQMGINDDLYLGINYHQINDKIFLIFHEHPKNVTQVYPDKELSTGKYGGVPVLVTIDKNGEPEKNLLFNSKPKKTILIPISGIRVSKNEQIFLNNFKNKRKLCRIIYN